MALGKKEICCIRKYPEVSGRVILADGGGVVAAGEASEKEESVKASVSVA